MAFHENWLGDNHRHFVLLALISPHLDYESKNELFSLTHACILGYNSFARDLVKRFSARNLFGLRFFETAILQSLAIDCVILIKRFLFLMDYILDGVLICGFLKPCVRKKPNLFLLLIQYRQESRRDIF